MAIFASNRHISVQFIDDDAAQTIAAASTMGTDSKANVEAATVLGQRAAETAMGKGIRMVVVDRGGHAFHGRVKAVVDAALAAGLSTGGAKPAAEPAAPEAAETEAAETEEAKEEK